MAITTFRNGILQLYGATGESSSLQFVDEESLPPPGKFINDFHGVFTVRPGDIIQPITRWGEPEDKILDEAYIEGLMRALQFLPTIKIRYLPSESNKSWAYHVEDEPLLKKNE